MSFSVTVSRSLRLIRSRGKHAAPRGTVQAVPREPASQTAYHRRPAHAASMPRLTGPHAGDKNDEKAA